MLMVRPEGEEAVHVSGPVCPSSSTVVPEEVMGATRVNLPPAQEVTQSDRAAG